MGAVRSSQLWIAVAVMLGASAAPAHRASGIDATGRTGNAPVTTTADPALTRDAHTGLLAHDPLSALTDPERSGPPEELAPSNMRRVRPPAAGQHATKASRPAASAAITRNVSLPPLQPPPDAPVAWRNRIAPPNHSWEFTLGVAAAPDGRLAVVAGASTGKESGYDALVAAFDPATGEQRWLARVDLTGGFDIASAVAMSPDSSRVYVTGYGTGDGFAVLTLAYDAATGAEVWRAVHDPPAGDAGAYALALSADGRTLFATGTASSPDGRTWTVLTAAYDAATGRELWLTRVPGPGDISLALSADASPDGGTVVVTGVSRTAIPRSAFTLAQDARTGAPRWTSVHASEVTLGWASGRDVEVDAERAYITGFTERQGTRADYVTVAYDLLTGAPAWTSFFAGAGGASDVGSSLALAPDGTTLYVTGTTVPGFAADYGTVAYDTGTGAEIWRATYDAGGNYDAASAVAVTDDGTVVTTGTSDAVDGRGLDMATVAYASDGAERWSHRFDHTSAADGAFALATVGDRVVVAGDSWGGSSLFDHAIVVLDEAGATVSDARYDGPGAYGYDQALETVTSHDGATVYVAGASHDDALRIRTVAHDTATGEPRWQAVHKGAFDEGGAFIAGDVPTGLAVSPDDRKVFVTGWSDVLSHEAAGYRLLSTDWTTAAHDTETGDKLWSATWGNARQSETPVDVVPSPDGATVYVAGTESGRLFQDYTDVIVVAYDAATGAQRWEARFDNGDDTVAAAALSLDGSTLFTAGRGWNRDFGYHVLVLAFDTSDGTVRWVARRAEGGDFFTSVADLSVTEDGRHVVVAASPESEDRFPDFETTAFDTQTGAEVWTSAFDQGGSYETAEGLDISGDLVVVTGRSIPPEAMNSGHLMRGNDMAAVAYDAATGRELWRATHDTGALPEVRLGPEDLSFTVAVGASTVVIGGFRWNSDFSSDYVALGLDRRTGTVVWQDRYDGGGGGDEAWASSASPDGTKVFVTGSSDGAGTQVDFVTTAYDTD